MYSDLELKRLFKKSIELVKKYADLLEACIEMDADYLDSNDHKDIKQFIQSIEKDGVEEAFENFYFNNETIVRDAIIKVLESLGDIERENHNMFLGEAMMNMD